MSTKKKRKPLTRTKPARPARFSVGDRLRVKYGVPDPDFPDIPLGGWAGTVAEIDDNGKSYLYLIAWNQFTLDHVHPVFRKRCERDGLDEESAWMGERDLEPDVGDRLPLEQPTAIATRPLRLTDQDDRIRAIFGLTSDDPLPESSDENLRRYHAYLAANLTFPFEAAYWRSRRSFQSSHQCKVRLVGLVALDCYCPEEDGLLFHLQRDGEEPTVVQTQVGSRRGLFGFLSKILGLSAPPSVDEDSLMALGDLELAKKDRNRQLLKDFAYWYWNH